ncbi:response regulator transcription factor [Paraburkholderia sp. BL21I4N1]|uniref:response regulator transcription factor n=1 Tax=Paraburkholderia sp. BL21I4N1 TaxID=1938801 RepID=UPI000CFC8F7B|nr:response regulator transcription factor [Paraburkholderia sp. BL21I4N1]PQV49755.1 LuxR family two component transcriptional regulator [Paraburkholderia sp. BL21I4N1]
MIQTTTDSSEPVLPGPMLVVEDEALMQVRMRAVLGKLGYADEELSFAGDLASARAQLRDQPYAMVLVDVGLPDGNGIDLIRELHERDPALPVLVISAWSTEQVILTALQAGATGYLLKERDDVEMTISIRSALRGGAPIDPFVARRILDLFSLSTHGKAAQPGNSPDTLAVPRLSRRECEILALVGKGLTNREIANLLSLSKLTVECHIKNIYKKLAVNSRTQAIFEARSFGLLP